MNRGGSSRATVAAMVRSCGRGILSAVDADAIIIGAGASGLAAAARLQAGGRHALVLEARARLGGRIHTDRSFADFPVERGAELISGARSRTREVAHEAGLRLAPAMSTWRGRIVDGDRVRRLVPWLLGRSLEMAGLLRDLGRPRPDDESLAALLDRRRASPQLRRLVEGLTNSACACPEQLGVRALSQFLVANEETGGDDRALDGYDRLVEHLARGVETIRDAPVAAIEWSASGVRVDAGRVYTARLVIVTVPLGVLQARSLRFQPALPAALTTAIDGLAMHGGMKVLLRFSAPLWPRGMSFLMLDDVVPVVWPPRDHRPVLTAFVMGSRAEALRAPPGPVERVLSALRAAWGDEPRRSLIAAAVVDWGADPWTLGGYSSVPPGAHGLREVLAAQRDTLLFAGEAADAIAPGTVGGAIRAGEQAADAAILQMGGPHRPPAPLPRG